MSNIDILDGLREAENERLQQRAIKHKENQIAEIRDNVEEALKGLKIDPEEILYEEVEGRYGAVDVIGVIDLGDGIKVKLSPSIGSPLYTSVYIGTYQDTGREVWEPFHGIESLARILGKELEEKDPQKPARQVMAYVDPEYDKKALVCIDKADGAIGDIRAGMIQKAQVYALLHVAERMPDL